MHLLSTVSFIDFVSIVHQIACVIVLYLGYYLVTEFHVLFFDRTEFVSLSIRTRQKFVFFLTKIQCLTSVDV